MRRSQFRVLNLIVTVSIGAAVGGLVFLLDGSTIAWIAALVITPVVVRLGQRAWAFHQDIAITRRAFETAFDEADRRRDQGGR